MSILKHKLKTKLGDNELMLAQTKDEKYVYVSKKGVGETEFSSELEMLPFPYVDLKHRQRSGIFISGISGSGKSTIAKQLIDAYIKLLGKDTRIILFTQTEDLDPVFEPLNAKTFVHVCIKTDPMYTYITPESLQNSVVVFDDYENLDKVLQSFTLTLIKDILERGRKMNIQTILINHQTQNYNKTRALIFECDTYILFPNSNRNSVKKFLLSYGDIDKKEVDSLIEEAMNPFDFLLFRKSVPRYIMTKNKIKLM